ncbi:MAG TPA: tetraacyldisaccharide 4'-kinase [Pelomicrobium sp.]|nr:tetraacyldisaccharide 4'-kinase [Pelomicrobium sp.]
MSVRASSFAASSWIERQWYRPTLAGAALAPLGWAFGAATALRRALFRNGAFASVRLRVPVIVVGNITVGGSGKTPLTIHLAGALRAAGRHPGIVSRGYGAQASHPRPVDTAGDARDFGDEPLLIARRTRCPVWVGHDRVAAAHGLLAAHPECDIVLADDGLQHYRLARDVEIAVVDGERAFGNGRLLPAGPLREPMSRLETVDAVVVNGDGAVPATRTPTFRMRLVPGPLYNLREPGRTASPAEVAARGKVHALAGIGNPGRFFATLAALGIAATAHALPDHHPYAPADLDLPDARAIVVTEKDALKCASFADDRVWVLPVDAVLDPDPVPHLLATAGRTHGPEAA